MKTIILAAGQGKRLYPLTKEKPKCMVELFGKSLLSRQILIMKSLGISDITLVTGYKKEMIKNENLKIIENPNFETTNMVETLFCAKDDFNDSVIVSYGDIIYEKKVLEKILKSSSDISIVVDKDWYEYWKIRFENPLDDAETLVLDEESNIKEIGQKTNDLKKIQGQYIGLMKFQGNGIKKLIRYYEKAKKLSKDGTNPLNPKLPFEQSYMTDLLQGMINEGFCLKAIPISNGWLEVDTLKDHETYTRLYNQGKLDKFFRP
jgi:choline kinase